MKCTFHIPIWEYSNYVFQKLLIIQVFENFTPFLYGMYNFWGNLPSSICGLVHSSSQPFNYIPDVLAMLSPLSLLFQTCYLQAEQQSHTKVLYIIIQLGTPGENSS